MKESQQKKSENFGAYWEVGFLFPDSYGMEDFDNIIRKCLALYRNGTVLVLLI